MAQSNLPTCEGDRAAWTDCFGSHTFASGNKYIGEYKDGKRNGQFIVTYANGSKYVGEFRGNQKNGRGTSMSVFKWFETDGLISQRRDWLIGFKV